MIRPAKCHFDGFIKAFIKGADKNHNPRKGTETYFHATHILSAVDYDKNHNPRKGTETHSLLMNLKRLTAGDKNHNPRKGTET